MQTSKERSFLTGNMDYTVRHSTPYSDFSIHMIQDFKDVDQLAPAEFEIFVRDLFIACGWSDAVITAVGKDYRHGDGGVDIFAHKNKKKFAIEVKQRSHGVTVDVSALNQLVTGARLANVQQMILVTNSFFTSEVKVRALRLGVELIDRDALQNLWIKKQCEIGRDIRPRTYQQQAIDDCLTQYCAGRSKFLLEMATGLGKTYTAAHIVKRILAEQPGKRILFLAHQVEILLQSVTAFKNVLGIGTYSYSACFDGAAPEDTDFVFASFDTLYTKLPALQASSFDIVIVDEAHHTPARTYANVVQHFRPAFLLGLTATPYRTDGLDVFGFFGGADGHIGKYDLAWGLRHNKLAFPKYEVLLDDLSADRLQQLQRGLSVADIDQRLFLHRKDEEVIAIIERKIAEKQLQQVKGIVFCRSVKHIRHLIQFFPFGTATSAHSMMTDAQRRDNIRDFREGAFKYILVCDLFNEGVDIPETNLLVFMRATASRTIWLQQLGRGLRKTPNKDYVQVLDFVGSLERLKEVQRLQEAVRKVKVSRSDVEPTPRGEDAVLHDSTLHVEYSESAAQVLTLIEELEYRLASRNRLIKGLSELAVGSGRLPLISELEDVLDSTTYDQIATFFDSYFRYASSAAFSFVGLLNARSRLSSYVGEYKSKHGIVPSAKAVANFFKYKNLEEFTEDDVLHIIGDILDSATNSATVPMAMDEAGAARLQEPEAGQANSELQAELLRRYSSTVRSANDLRLLSGAERAEIKNMFISDFLFLKLLREAAQAMV